MSTQRPIDAVFVTHSRSLLAIPGVVGAAIGRCNGIPCIQVYLRSAPDALRAVIPRQLEGWAVLVEVTGPVVIRQ